MAYGKNFQFGKSVSERIHFALIPVFPKMQNKGWRNLSLGGENNYLTWWKSYPLLNVIV
jgi:hypothetical protein